MSATNDPTRDLRKEAPVREEGKAEPMWSPDLIAWMARYDKGQASESDIPVLLRKLDSSRAALASAESRASEAERERDAIQEKLKNSDHSMGRMRAMLDTEKIKERAEKAEREAEGLRKDACQLAAALRAVQYGDRQEWTSDSGTGDFENRCPACKLPDWKAHDKRYRNMGHEKGCVLAAALAAHDAALGAEGRG